MKIAVLGAGAIGAYVGAALHRASAEAHLIARGAHLAALRRDGVRVISPRGDFRAQVPATSDPTSIGPVDYVFLGLKATSYASAGPLIAPLLRGGAAGSTNGDQGTAIIAAQNGIPWWYFHGLRGPHENYRIEAVDPAGTVSSVLPSERAIGCVVYCSTEIAEPGVVRHLEGTRFSIGEPDGTDSARCRELSDAMVAGGLKCPVETDLRTEIWTKLMGNATFNPISALTRATMADICHHAGTRELVRTAMHECLAIAERVDSRPEVSVERRLAGAERVGHHKTSMLQDLEKGRPFELDAVLGAVVEIADLTGVAAPTLRNIHAATDLLRTTEMARCVPDGAGDGQADGTASPATVPAAMSAGRAPIP